MTASQMSRRLTGSALIVAVLLFAGLPVTAQTQSQYDKGTPPPHRAGVSDFGSYVSTDIGTVNLANGALNIKIPLGSVGGRGISLPLSLNYSSKVWSASTGPDYVQYPQGNYNQVYVKYAEYGAGDNLLDLNTRITPGWTIGGTPVLRARGVGIQGSGCGYVRTLVKLSVILPDKGEVQLRDDLTDGAPLPAQINSFGCAVLDGNRGERWHATDGSGMVFVSDNSNGVARGDLRGVLITSDGTRYRFESNYYGPLGVDNFNWFARCASITDRNGNKIIIGSGTYTDPLGRVTSQSAGPAYGETVVTLPGYGGQTRTYTIRTGVMNQHYRSDIRAQIPVGTPVINGDYDPEQQGYVWPQRISLFSQSWGYYAERIDDDIVVTELELPDGRKLQFAYNEFGEVAEVTLPTGGKIQYDYGPQANTLPAGNSLGYEVGTSRVLDSGGSGLLSVESNVSDVDRAVLARRLLENGTTVESNWTYTYSAQQPVGGTTSQGMTEVKAYAGSGTSTLLMRQRHHFLPAQRYTSTLGGTEYTLWSTGVEWRTETLNTSGLALSAAEQDWSQRAPVAWTSGYPQEQPENDNRVGQARQYLDDGSYAKVETFYDNVNNVRANNAAEVKEYDYDQTLKRRTVTDYLTTNPVNSQNYSSDAIFMLRLPRQQSIYDAGGVERARTVYEYDNYSGTNNATLQSYGVVVGHDSNYGTGNVTRGNPTAVGRWRNTDNATIYSYARFDMLGNVVSAKDANGNVSSISYADDFGDGMNPGTGGTGGYGATYAFPTLITSPDPGGGAHTARSQYDFNTGLLTGFKDRNGVITQTIYNDPFNRPRLVKAALGQSAETHTTMHYAPTTVFGVTLAKNDVLTARDQSQLDDGSLRSWTRTDGFGRVSESWTRDPQGDTKVITVYDALGRQSQVSNPLRAGETAVYTTTSYDLAGRVTSVQTPDGAQVTTAYSGNRVLVSDQAKSNNLAGTQGSQRVSVTDALGRLTEVWEVRSADAASGTEPVTFPGRSEVTAGYKTIYSYDTLGNLLRVQQGGQDRWFAYDSLSRLVRSRNVEQDTYAFTPTVSVTAGGGTNSGWSLAYSYDAAGNLLTRTDAENVTATYAYDALGRNTQVTYSGYPSGTAAVQRFYDNPDASKFGKGRLWYVVSYNTRWEQPTDNLAYHRTTVDAYDPLGRPTSQTQGVLYKNPAINNWDWADYNVRRAYDRAGNVLAQTYPSGRSVSYAYTAAGRLDSFSGNLGDNAQRSYASGLLYTAAGQLAKESFGTGQPLYHRSFYNSRLQAYNIALGTGQNGDAAADANAAAVNGAWDRGRLVNHYGSGDFTAWGTSGANNNGNLLRAHHYVPTFGSDYDVHYWDYSYDELNRLKLAVEQRGGSYGSGEQLRQGYSYDRWGNRAFDLANTTDLPGVTRDLLTISTTTNRLTEIRTGPGHFLIKAVSYDQKGNQTSVGPDSRLYDAENRMTKAVTGSSPSSYYYDADGKRVRRVAGSGGETWHVYGMDGELLAEYAHAGQGQAAPAPASPLKEYGYRNGELLVTAERVAPGAPAIPAGVSSTGFEVPALGVGAYQYNPTGAAWTFTGHSGVTANASAFTGSNPPAPEGLRVAFVQQTGQISQSVTLDAGRQYKLKFKAAQRVGNNQTLEVRLDGQVVGTFTPAGTAYADFETAGFTATTGSHTLSVVGTNPLGGDNTAFVDDLKLEWTALALAAVSVGNGGFETPSVGAGSFQYNPAGGTWAFTGNAGVSGNASGFTAGNPSAPEGAQVGFIQQTGQASQVVTLPATALYTVSLKAAQRGNVPASQTLEVRLDGVAVGTITPAGTAYASYQTAAFEATAGAHTLSIVGLNPVGGDHTAFIDDVKVEGAGTAALRWLVADHLGTPRIVVERSGAAASVTRHDYLPFGEEIPVALGGRTTPGENYGAPPDNLRQQFTGYERDTETGLDFAIARYYANSQGRFLSTDPYDVNMDRQYADDYERGNTILKSYILTPLRWNRYAYALNNPLRYIDPTGEKDEEIIKVRVNIVYDKGSLKTEEAARKLTAAAVADAKKTYATAGIQLEISFTPGAASTTNAENKTQAITEGRAEGAINIFVSNDLTHHTAGRSNASTGESFVNYGRGYGSFGPLAPQDDIFSHEIGHQLGPNSTNGYSNLASDLVIDRDNAFLRAGQTRQVVMKPAPGRNSTHVQTPVSREVPAMKMYREGARKYAPK